MPRILLLLVAAALLLAGCNEHPPVLPTDPGPPGAPVLLISIVSDRTSLNAGSPSPAMLTISVRQQDGTAPADGTEVALNTNLGHFGLGADGKPQQLVTTKLAAGTASVPFYAGSDPGTANVRAQIGTSTGQLNLAIGVPVAAPVADFDVTVSGLRALFADMSTGGAAARLWTFGDGSQSTEVSPTHDYATAGTYTATLTLTNSGGQSAKSKFVTVPNGPPLAASFTAQPNGLTVIFTDTSTGNPTSWLWDFGDSKFSTEPNPQHVYGGAGTYAVTLTVRDAAGRTSSATSFVTIGGAAPVAEFKADAAGLRVLFTDLSTGNPTTWRWDFGDGSPLGTEQNPLHDYAQPGTYTVTLTAGNVAGSSSKSHFVVVSLGDPPKAAFTYKAEGLDVAFTDASTGAPTTWEWDFGDRTAHDTRQNPTHHYATSGNYVVTLTVRNAAGESTTSQIVKIVGPPTADFQFGYASADQLTVAFSDTSSGSPTAWLWSFGDCDLQKECTSTAQNPVHKYTAPGMYTVTLTVTNAAGQSTTRKVVPAGQPQAAFSYTKAGLVVTFINESTNAPETFLWEFGDCGTNPNCTSSDKNPKHTYLAPGTYLVRLTATNAGGTSRSSQYISVP